MRSTIILDAFKYLPLNARVCNFFLSGEYFLEFREEFRGFSEHIIVIAVCEDNSKREKRSNKSVYLPYKKTTT